MNRHQRRKAVRDGRWQATGTGHAHRARPVVELPAKEPARHRWVAMTMYTLSAPEAAAADGGAVVVLGPDKLASFNVGCWDCEGVYQDVRADPCPAGDEWTRP